jgi:hypothetical protein
MLHIFAWSSRSVIIYESAVIKHEYITNVFQRIVIRRQFLKDRDICFDFPNTRVGNQRLKV